MKSITAQQKRADVARARRRCRRRAKLEPQLAPVSTARYARRAALADLFKRDFEAVGHRPTLEPCGFLLFGPLLRQIKRVADQLLEPKNCLMASQTRSTCASVMPTNSGKDRHSRAYRSATGKLWGSATKRASAGWACKGIG